MPGWYIHMDVARKALGNLAENPGAAPIFGANGPSAADISGIAKSNPAYAALGAIGPDIFFLLPDFKPPVGSMLFGAANTIREIYTWWDDNFLGPWEDQIGPIADNLSDEVDAVTGGLASQLSGLLSRAFSFLMDTALVMIVRQYDVFSFLGSGVPSGYDEQAFFWSDMLHYRKTYEFAAHLWKKANDANDDRFRAFALGWMSHLATDVAGHCFVNEKSGGPYRLHWQRHHLVENHMDGKVCDVENGTKSIYNMLSNAALHLWIAFRPDGSSHNNFFKPQPGPNYPTGDKTPDLLGRKAAWDVDSALPDDLGNFIAEALREVYNPANANTAGSKGQCADHPTIWESIVPGSAGYVKGEDVVNTYWWLYHYVKFTTTDFYKTRRPSPPDIVNIPPFPSPPGSGESDPGPGPSDDSAWHDFLEILLAIFAWIAYLAQVALWPATAIIGLITSAGTYPVRELIYENLELPLYNAWLALHWYLAMSGFVYPMQQELNMGLNTLGLGVGDVWGAVQNALGDLDGGLTLPATPNEPSGSDLDNVFPIDVVNDPQGFLSNAIHQVLNNTCGAAEAPSEFLRPWLWPARDNQGDVVPSEFKPTEASPYHSLQDCTAIMGGLPGNAAARNDYEKAQKEDDTISASTTHLPHGETLGDAVDYTSYVVARLTRDNLSTKEITNFNLDSDRGYGYLCWDWVRSKELMGVPAAFKNDADKKAYHLPLHPGSGWCKNEATGALPPQDPAGVKTGVRIRYIDREDKFQ
jgi:hypothetical protein